MESAEVSEANRQLAIRALLRAIHDVMRGAVHRLDAKAGAPSFGTGVDQIALIGLGIRGEEHILAKEFPMPRSMEELVAENLRRDHFAEAVAMIETPHVCDQFIVDGRATREEKRTA